MSDWVIVAPSTSVRDKSKDPQPRALQESVIVLGPLAALYSLLGDARGDDGCVHNDHVCTW